MLAKLLFLLLIFFKFFIPTLRLNFQDFTPKITVEVNSELHNQFTGQIIANPTLNELFVVPQ